MSKWMYDKVVAKIPDIAETLVREHADDLDEKNFTETLCEYSRTGDLIRKDVYALYNTEVIRHLKTAKKRGCEISFGTNDITVRRNLRCGDYFIVKYAPI